MFYKFAVQKFRFDYRVESTGNWVLATVLNLCTACANSARPA